MPATALVTSEQYLALPDEFDQNGNRIKDELIGGEIVRTVLPSNSHDRMAKVEAYLANGARAVWVVFPESKAVVVHSAGSMRELKGGQRIEDSLLPGFSVPVSVFFELT